jgi:hypothetical protein
MYINKLKNNSCTLIPPYLLRNPQALTYTTGPIKLGQFPLIFDVSYPRLSLYSRGH